MTSDDDLLRVLRNESDLLDSVFGRGSYELVDSRRGCALRTQMMEMTFGYDYRDGWLSASIQPLQVPRSLSEPMPLHFWLRFVGKEERAAAIHEPLGRQHVSDLLNRLAPILPSLRDLKSARDAAQFVNGYHTAVGDWLGKRGHWSGGDFDED